jgi:hypothetical protein
VTERFSLRRVNPFLGAVAVVKTDAGRAVRRAVLLNDLFALYPPVARPDLLRGARVEASLRRASA